MLTVKLLIFIELIFTLRIPFVANVMLKWQRYFLICSVFDF